MISRFADECCRCVNRGKCDYAERYTRGITDISIFLAEHPDLDWYGRISMKCDYYFHNNSTDELVTCDGGTKE